LKVISLFENRAILNPCVRVIFYATNVELVEKKNKSNDLLHNYVTTKKEIKKVKYTSFILLCLVLLSLFYGYSATILSYSTLDTKAMHYLQNANSKASTYVLSHGPLGDPIVSPKPNARATM
jgi:TRAP-type uncharacterized transport system fused permease subunit